MNDETGKVNSALDGQIEDTIPNVAKRWKSRGQGWMIVTDVSKFLTKSSKSRSRLVIRVWQGHDIDDCCVCMTFGMSKVKLWRRLCA